jgi:FecR protein
MLKYYGGFALALIATVIWGSAAFADDLWQKEAVVTLVQGTARVITKGVPAGRALKKGDKISKDDTIKVADKSRLEMLCPDGTVMRFSAKSNVRMSEIRYNKQTTDKNIRVNLAVGKLWAKVKRIASPDSSVIVETSNAVAGVRGTVYRVNVEDDQSALIRVYDGSVYVASPPKETAGKPPVQVSKPAEVPGPSQVSPPYHEVTLQEWTYIVHAMQQITVSPQGAASQPQNFDPKADADEWVKWNQERDTTTTF